MSIKFESGQIVATPGALEALREAGQQPSEFLSRFLAGDWGDLDDEDKTLNDEALVEGSRILSSYVMKTGQKLWLITEATGDDGKRASTCLLLPDEY
jgi:hypothetical protein